MPIEVVNLRKYGLRNLRTLLVLYNQFFYKKSEQSSCTSIYIVKIKHTLYQTNLNISLFLKDTTRGADLTLVFINELNDENLGMSYYYRIFEEKTTIFIKRPVLFRCQLWFVNCDVSLFHSKALS